MPKHAGLHPILKKYEYLLNLINTNKLVLSVKQILKYFANTAA